MTLSQSAVQLAIILVRCLITSGMASEKYSAVKSSDSSALCAVDGPTVSMKMRRGSKLRCAGECTKRPNCLTHQMNDELELCQLYDYLATNFTTVNKCQAFNVVRSPGTGRACSFPFTFSGGLYYSCAVDYSSLPSSVWCLDSNAVKITCPSTTYGFVAQNVTVNVTIPSVANTVSLRSVNGWITILSRIDAGFPTGLSYQSYIDGFGNITDNFWLGLERIYQLTNSATNGGRNYRLRFEMLNLANKWYSEEYATFYLNSSATNYVLRVSGAGVGDADDAINNPYSPANGMYFMMSGTCASRNGPWWYTSAMYCCYGVLFGQAYPGGGFAWSTPGHLQAIRMMIKPN